ncbi:patatin-like phospholipase family protein [Paraburkholderia sp. SARCC-3016]|uniref:patatin-like phospholipase family protein n=1 Tax=Paraburkholderia sp. SARCC-3016 TaxID=3058611 RepID=UPI002807601D|nr:patatin-like phospholipase family protein [Paraburkholderia sp. SARCC-3016]MDQ7981337.1 patatin-like phospholipase family protein [Paraburkholderia sp. SARCC-3016]
MTPIRVALSGSGFRLSAHLGALWAIVEAGYRIIELAGTSGGSIVAALYASGVNLKDMRELCMSLDWSPMMRFSPWSMLTGKGLCSGDALQRFLLQATQGKTFASVDIELKAIAADLLTEKEFLFSRERTPDVPIAIAARASASIPIVFPPVACAGAMLVDGGTCDNVPASDLTVDGIRRIGIYLVSDDEPLAPGNYGLSTLAPRIIDLMLSSNEAAHVALDTANGAEIVRVPTGYASSFDRNMPIELRQRLFDDGYAETARALRVQRRSPAPLVELSTS